MSISSGNGTEWSIIQGLNTKYKVNSYASVGYVDKRGKKRKREKKKTKAETIKVAVHSVRALYRFC